MQSKFNEIFSTNSLRVHLYRIVARRANFGSDRTEI